MEFGMSKSTAQHLQMEARNYAECSTLGEPISGTDLIRGYDKFRLEAYRFLQAVKTIPFEVQAGAFVFDDRRNYMYDEEHAEMKRKLERIIENCNKVAKSLTPSDRHTHKKFWPRHFISRIAWVLTPEGWDFRAKQWVTDGDYHRLSRIIEILNESMPDDCQISKPERLVKELFIATSSGLEKRPRK